MNLGSKMKTILKLIYKKSNKTIIKIYISNNSNIYLTYLVFGGREKCLSAPFPLRKFLKVLLFLELRLSF